ncbi:MAG: hypothetical protein AB1529_07640 [Candidatus Micrarchaeota archaeon]
MSLSPKSFQPADFTDFFEKANRAGSVVTWAGDWNELGSENGGPKVVAGLASTYNYTPVVIVTFFTQSDGKLLRPLDEDTKRKYKEGAVAYAEKYKPEYLGLGIEVNMLYEKSPEDFDSFAQFYSEVYDAVKEKSPGTKVFTVFQLEKIKGLGGGLFGGASDPSKSEWGLLDRFPDSDLVAFTTYPGLVYKEPSELPPDYYSEIKGHTTKPVAFTEIGWHSSAVPEGWESSDGEQAEFVATFFNRTADLHPELAVWSFLYDQGTSEPFDSMGLIRADGVARPAFDAWVSNATQ